MVVAHRTFLRQINGVRPNSTKFRGRSCEREADLEPAESLENSQIFVLDDDRVAREALRLILGNAGCHVTCFGDERALLQSVRHHQPTCILLDLHLPGRSGLEILEDLARYHIPVIMISGHGDIPTAVKAIKGGALDFIQKPFLGEELVRQIENALEASPLQSRANSQGHFTPATFRGRATLTRRELEVLELIASGSSNKEAALALALSPRTIEDHRAQIMRKLDVTNAIDLMRAILK